MVYFWAHISYPADVTGTRIIYIYINGSFYTGDACAVSTNTAYKQINSTRYLSSGDYIEIRTFQSSGGSLDADDCKAWISRIATGPQGDTGLQGETGTGLQGETGLQGATGVGGGGSGETGLQGETGIQGATGVGGGGSGETGLQGETGPCCLVSEQGANVYITSGQSIPNNSFTTIDFDAERRDDGDFWDAGTSDRFIIKEPGWYNIGASANYSSSISAGTIHIRRNDATNIVSQDTTDRKHATSIIYYLEEDDYVQTAVYQGSGGSRTVDEASMWIARVTAGPQGDTGLQGETGTGLQGETGLQGATGVGGGGSGETGLQGETGIQGVTGVGGGGSGETGLQGVTGPCCLETEQGSYVTRSSSTSVPNNTDVYIDFESETRDDGDFWDSGNSDRFIIKEAGWYDIGGHGIWQSGDGTGRRVIHIRINGTSITSSSQYYYRQSIDATYYLEKDDYVQISVFWGSAGTATLDSAAMWISRLATGPQGDTGVQGETGVSLGETGLQGVTGLSGSVSEQGAVISRSTSQTIPDSDNTLIQFTTEERDDNNFFDSGQNTRLTVPEDGWYTIGSYISWSSASNDRRKLTILKNGSELVGSQVEACTSGGTKNVANTSQYFVSGDYFEFNVQQDRGASLDVVYASAWICRIATGPSGRDNFETGMINFSIVDDGSALATGLKGDIQWAHDYQIDSWHLYGTPTGSIELDLLRGTFDEYPFVTGSQMHSGATGPFITDGVKQKDLNISDWPGITGVSGEIISVNVNSVTGIKRATLALTYHKI